MKTINISYNYIFYYFSKVCKWKISHLKDIKVNYFTLLI